MLIWGSFLLTMPMIHFVISFRRFNRWTQLQYAIQLIRIFSSVKTVVVCSYLIKYIDSFYCRIIFLMCCLFSFPFANSNSYHSSSVGFDYTVLPDCFNIDFPIWDKNIRTLLNLPWMRVYRSIRVFFSCAYAHTWYLRGLLHSFFHLVVI